MVVRLVTGCSWEDAERLLDNQVSDTTMRSRRDEWIEAGVFELLVHEAQESYDRIIGLDLSETAVDGSLHKSPCGGAGTGKNPTDRAKLGWKWSILTDRNGIPIGWAIDGANRHDSVLLGPTLDDAGAKARRRRHRSQEKAWEGGHAGDSRQEAHPRHALAGGADQLVALELRSVTAEH